MKNKSIGFIGLGKMGMGVCSRLLSAGYRPCVFDKATSVRAASLRKGFYPCSSPREVALRLSTPRVVFLCVPAGRVVDALISELIPLLSKGDFVIDLGNSFYGDSIRRGALLKRRGISFVDVGMSGGVDGAKKGACLMIGGEGKKVLALEPFFKAISDGNSYAYFNKIGSGHLVKGFHNLIEYGYLQALAEGLESLSRILKRRGGKLNLARVCEIWSKGSIIESKLVSYAEKALGDPAALKRISGSVRGQTLPEMQTLLKLAAGEGVKLYVSGAAIKARQDSLKTPTYSGKVVNAIRNVFGGHAEWKK